MPLPAALQAFFLTAPSGAQNELVTGSLVEPLLDGESYYRELGAALSALGKGTITQNQTAGEFIHITGLMLNWTGLEIPNAAGTLESLETVILDKAAKGVDVRVLGWAHYALNPPFWTARTLIGVVSTPLDAVAPAVWNAETARLILRLRAAAVGAGAALNVLSHPGGSAHAKLVIVGNSTSMTAFSGGIDLTPKRYALMTHPGDKNSWHDIVIKVQGLGAKSSYLLFMDLWRQNQTNPPITFRIGGGDVTPMSPAATVVPLRIPTPAPVGGTPHYVQSLRTLPARMSVATFTPDPPAYFWPASGVFEIRDAILLAITQAKKYIYIEDQYFWSEEIFVALKTALTDAARPDLRVVLLTGSMQDPSDEAKVKTYRDYLMWLRLVVGLTPSQLARLKFCFRWGDILPPAPPDHVIASVTAKTGSATTDVVVSDVTADGFAEDAFADMGAVFLDGAQRFRIKGNPASAKDAALQFYVEGGTGNPRMTAGTTYQLQYAARIFVHSKTMIVDDSWALIGSANMARRGMRTDIEQAIAFTSEDGGIVKDYRKSLWAHHVRISPSTIDDVNDGLNIFFPPAPHRWRPETEFPDYIEPGPLASAMMAPPADLAKFQNKYDADSTIPDWSPL